MVTRLLTVGCVLTALAGTSYAAEIQLLDDEALDRVIAGSASTGIDITARTGVDDNNSSRALAGLSFRRNGEGGNATANVDCELPCSSTGTLAAAALDNDIPLRQLLADEGANPPTPDGTSYGAYGLADGGYRQLEAVAFGPTGTAEAQAKVVPLVQTDAISATVGFGRGSTTGDGEVGMTGVVHEGQGMGRGYAIKSPSGDTLLFGLAIAVDREAIQGAMQMPLIPR